MKDDDVEFGRVKADEGDIGREGDGHTERCDLDLKIESKGFDQTDIGNWIIEVEKKQEYRDMKIKTRRKQI